MSRIGKLPIPVPSGVSVDVQKNHVRVEGPRGTLERGLPSQISIRVEGQTVVCERPSDGREHRSLHGLTRTLVANMVAGVSAGFRNELELVGVGYRAQKQGNDLVLSLGFSHPVRYTPPAGIAVEVADPTHFSVSGISKEQVGQVAADPLLAKCRWESLGRDSSYSRNESGLSSNVWNFFSMCLSLPTPRSRLRGDPGDAGRVGRGYLDARETSFPPDPLLAKCRWESLGRDSSYSRNESGLSSNVWNFFSICLSLPTPRSRLRGDPGDAGRVGRGYLVL